MTARRKTGRTLLALALAAAFASGALAGPARPGGGGAAPQKKKKVSEEKDPKYQCELGVIALRYGLPDQAVLYGRQAVALDPSFFDGWQLLGSAYAQKGELVQAAEAFEKAAAIKPGAGDVQRQLGLVYLGLNETAKAESALKTAFDAGGDAESAYALGKLFYTQKRFDEAMDYAVKAIQKDGKSAKAYNLKGVLLNQKGRYAEAAGAFQAGLVLLPEDVGLQVNLGIALFNSGESTRARKVFEAVLPRIEAGELKKQVQDYIQAIKDAGK
ncbi:MAG: tetratricopeptide repeat protein [Acidobacteriota bacterium]